MVWLDLFYYSFFPKICQEPLIGSMAGICADDGSGQGSGLGGGGEWSHLM